MPNPNILFQQTEQPTLAQGFQNALLGAQNLNSFNQIPMKNELLKQTVDSGRQAIATTSRDNKIKATYQGLKTLRGFGTTEERLAQAQTIDNQIQSLYGVSLFDDDGPDANEMSDKYLDSALSSFEQALGRGQVAGIRELDYITQGFTPEEKAQAMRVKARIVAPAGESADERIARDAALASMVAKSQSQIAGAKEGAEQIQKSIYEPGRAGDVAVASETGKISAQVKMAPLLAEAKGKIETAVTLATKEATARGEALTDLKKAEAGLPGIKQVIGELRGLSAIATHTKSGRAFDFAVKEAGFGSTKGATARAKYQGVIDNQVLPLLKQFFGAAMTEGEGKRLTDTLGDIDAAPEAKQAQLDAFLESQERQIKTLKREVKGGGTGQAGAASPQSGVKFMGFE